MTGKHARRDSFDVSWEGVDRNGSLPPLPSAHRSPDCHADREFRDRNDLIRSQPSVQHRSQALPPRRSRRSRGARGFAIALFFIAGLAFFMAPLVLDYLDRVQADQLIDKALAGALDEPTGTASDETAAGSSGTSASAASGGESYRPKTGDSAYDYLSAYNERVRTGQAEAVNDPWGLGSDADELANVGLPDGIVGAIEVPSMNVRLPLYLGASSARLNAGAAVVSGTSAPLGEVDSNCVIAAHRGGRRGNSMFRDIESVKTGDLVYVRTLWETLVYRATEIQVVPMEDVGAVKVRPGRDMITLLTCDPYMPTGGATHRYLVFCERATDIDPSASEGAARKAVDSLFALNPIAQALQPSDSPWLIAERWLRVAGLVILAVAALTLLVRHLHPRA